MPKYFFTSPNGELYEIDGPDGSTREQAFNILQEGIKNGYYKPKSTELGRAFAYYKSLGNKALGALDVGANFLSQMVGTPTAGVIAGAAAPFIGVDKAEQFRKDMMENAFNAPPISSSGKVANEAIGEFFNNVRDFGVREGEKVLRAVPGLENANDLTTPAEIGTDLFMNFAPLHGVVEAPKALLKGRQKSNVGNEPIASGQGTIASKLSEMQKPAEVPNAQEAGQKAFQNITDSQLTGWNEPIRNNAPNPGQSMPFIVQQLERQRQEAAQRALEARQTELEQQVGRQTSLDMNAAERARQQAAPVPGLEEARLREIEDSIAKTQELNTRGQQMSIVEDFGNNDPMSRMPNMRVDENGIPIRADLSIEAQQLQNPLQRNLWGDELPVRTGDGGVPLTQAIDNMFPGPERDLVISQLSGFRKSQTGFIDFNTFLAAFPKFRGTKATMLLYHGTTSDIKGDIRASSEGALGSGVYLAVRPEYASGYAEGKGGNVHQVYADIKNPLIIDGPGDPMINAFTTLGMPRDKAVNFVEKAYDRDGYIKGQLKARASKAGYDGIFQYRNGQLSEVVAFDSKQVKSAVSPDSWTSTQHTLDRGDWVPKGPGASQSGGVNFGFADKVVDLINKYKPAKPTTPKDSINSPRTPETIQAKETLNKKAKAIGETAYDRVTTPEEVIHKASPDVDISKVGDNSLRSGSEAVLRTNPKNPLINFIRSMGQKARNDFEVFSKQWVTGQDGVVAAVNALRKDKEALASVAEALVEGDRRQMVFTDEHFQSFGWNEKQVTLYKKIREAFDALYALHSDVAMTQGFEPVKPRPGYVPSNFDGAFISFVGFTDKNGRWVTTGIAQGRSTKEVRAAIAKYKEMGEKYAESKPVEFRGLKEKSADSYSKFSGFQDLIARLAEIDPKGFGKAKRISDQAVMDDVRALYRYDVHELKKSGVRGALGDRPWLTREENTTQLFKSIVDHLEEGARYNSMQGFLMDTAKLAKDEKVRSAMPNAASWAEKYVANIQGSNLGNIGAAVNKGINNVMKFTGQDPRKLTGAMGVLQDVSTTAMMGMFNVGFATVQMLQPAMAFPAEAMRIKAATGLTHTELANVTAQAHINSLLLPFKFLHKHLDPDVLHAYTWGKERGLVDFSEAQLAHELLVNPYWKGAKKVANLSISLPEKMTRPPVFLAYYDMFKRAGYVGEEALLRAQAATDYSMVNYHMDERPMVYQQLGQPGKALGALSTYKHNLVEQWVNTWVNKGTQPEAAAAMIATALMFYGVTGMPGYDHADQLFKKLTGGKSIREVLLSDPTKGNVLLDGALSALTNVDFQTRLSTSHIFPDPTNPANIAPHVGNISSWIVAGYEAGKNQDEASLRNLAYTALPSSARNVYEMEGLTDVNGMVRKADGSVKSNRPWTDSERKIREVGGFRPLDERLTEQTLYGRQQRLFNDAKKRKEAQDRFVTAIGLGDKSGAVKARDKFLEYGGDPSQLDTIEKALIKKNMTPTQRAMPQELNDLSQMYNAQIIQGQR